MWAPRMGRHRESEKATFIPVLLGETSALHSNSKTCRSPLLKQGEPTVGHAATKWASGGEAPCSGLPVIPLGHTGLRGGPVEPLGPGAIIDGHIRLAAEVGRQGNVAGGDTLPACGDDGLCEVYLLVLEHGTEHLWALLQAVLCQEVHEWHVGRASDMARIQSWDKGKDRVRKAWGGERGKWGLEAATSHGCKDRGFRKQK